MAIDDNTPEIVLKQTPLHELHVELGAKMVPFAGYDMPVSYTMGILKEHTHTRNKAGLFDVSHMGQIHISGEHTADALETLVPVSLTDLEVGQQRYALFTNDSGGVLDDLMITNIGEHLLLVVNAARKEHDFAHLTRHLGKRCDIELVNDRGLLALQGPAAAAVMKRLAPDSQNLVFMRAKAMEVDKIPCYVSRSGYTGEDGFEISVPADDAQALAQSLLSQSDVEPIGLGARDSLRLEAGLCLYGHELDVDTTPVQANLKWALSRNRRRGGSREGGFPGADIILDQLANGTAQTRVGILPEGKAPLRDGTELFDEDENLIGRVTSGGYGPSLGRPIAMGYISSELSNPGHALNALVRGKERPAQVAMLPFIMQRYYRG